MTHLRPIVLERLMQYHRYLTETRGAGAPPNVPSAEIAEALDVDPTQVRKDLGAIGLRGVGRVGFEADEIVKAIRRVLGFDQSHRAIVVGAGHLGGALAAYAGFARYGVEVVAAFDSDPAKVGERLGRVLIQRTDSMVDFIRNEGIRLAILTTPAAVAQKVAEELVEAGVTAIWNFAPIRLRLPSEIMVRHEHVSLGLSELSYYLKR